MAHIAQFYVWIPNDTEAAREVQERIVGLMEQNAWPMRDCFGVRLALEEALVNAIKHGNRLDPLKKVEIEFTVAKTRFEVHITDEGPGYVPAEVPDCKADENLTRPGGRGLFLMRHYMTEVVVEPPGNRLFMTKIHANGSSRTK